MYSTELAVLPSWPLLDDSAGNKRQKIDNIPSHILAPIIHRHDSNSVPEVENTRANNEDVSIAEVLASLQGNKFHVREFEFRRSAD